MEIGQMYQYVLLLVLVGIVIGVGVMVLDKLGGSSSVTVAASTAINSTRDQIAGIASNWLGIITIVVIAAIILGLVMSSFGQNKR